jgi:hypothetical protein
VLEEETMNTAEGERDPDRPAEIIDVDAELENAIERVRQAAATYLVQPSTEPRNNLLAELERLDEQINRGDEYTTKPFASGFVGYLSNPAIGATTDHSVGEDVPDDLFQAQIELVKAAKEEVRLTTRETLRDLRTAAEALDNLGPTTSEPPAV